MFQTLSNGDVRKGKVDLILVSDLTRLSRNLLDFCSLINELEKHRASYLSMKEQFDTSTPIGRMMVYIIIALGQFEREQTSERVAVNCHSRALRGLVNGGPAPLGFEKNPEKPGLLTPNPEEALIVRKIFQTLLEEGSRAKTIARLHEMGIRPKKPKSKDKVNQDVDWTVQSLGTLLKNPAYIGYREVNKLYKEDDQSYLKPWQKHQIVKAAWPGILDEKVFNDVQKLLTEALESERTRLAKGELRSFLLTGLLTCGETGLPLVGQSAHGSKGTLHRYYHYSRKPKGVSDVRSRLHADELEEKVIEEFKRALEAKGYFKELQRTFQDLADEKGSGNDASFRRAKGELLEVTKRIDAIWANQAQMQLEDAALRLVSEELNRLAKRKQELEKYVHEIETEQDHTASPRDQALFVENQIRWCMQGWAKAKPSVRKRLLRRTIKEIVVTRTELQITFWTAADERDNALRSPGQGDADVSENVVALRRRAPGSRDQNESIKSSGNIGNGSERRT